MEVDIWLPLWYLGLNPQLEICGSDHILDYDFIASIAVNHGRGSFQEAGADRNAVCGIILKHLVQEVNASRL